MSFHFIWNRVSQIRRHPETKAISSFILLLLVYSFLQLFLSIKYSSTLLTIDALFSLLHVISSLLTASEVIGKQASKEFPYSYGFGRLEILLDFSVSLFITFVFLFILAESALEFIAPDLFGHGHDSHAKGVEVSVALAFFSILFKVISYSLSPRTYGSSGRVSRYNTSSHSHRHIAQQSQPRELLTELSVSIVVFLCLLNNYFDILHLGVLESMICGFVAIYVIFPLFRSSGLVLLQTVPVTELAPMDRARREILGIQGVVEVKDQKSWVQTPGELILCACLKIKSGANQDDILQEARAIYSRIATTVTIELDSDSIDVSQSNFSTSIVVQ